MEHRGATGADPDTGDGAGLLLQLSGRLPAPLGARGGRHRAAPAGRVRRRDVLPAARSRAAADLRGAPRAHHARGGPGAARLARRAGRQRPRRADRARERARDPAALRGAWPRRRRRRLPAQAVRDPPPRRARVVDAPARRVHVLDRELLEHDAHLQGAAPRLPARPVLPRPAGSAGGVGDGPRPLALLDEHARNLGSRPALPLPRAQRRDQHRPRQPVMDARARAEPALGAARRRPREALPDHRRALVRLRGARCRARAARHGRAHAGARADDADPGGVAEPRRDAR